MNITKPKIHNLKLIKIKCPECRRYFDSRNAINNHLTKSHDADYKIYIDSQGLAYLRKTLRYIVE